MKKLNHVLLKNFIKTKKMNKNYQKKNDFLSTSRVSAINEAEKENYEVAILDDGLQDKSINYDTSFVCFNNMNWIGMA